MNEMSAKKDLHPILRQLDPSPEQEKPILSPGKDIVVTAGAGTGKTRTLVARFLGLLAEGLPLRAVVAITFTNKAAREMRNRIREEVRKYLLSGRLSGQERVKWQGVYQELDGARISTIHSLAGDILRQHPAELGLDPEFELLDEGQSARMKALAVEAALAWAGGDDLASGLFPIFGAWKLRRVLGELMNKRLDVASVLSRLLEDLWSAWQPALIEPIRTFVEDPVVRSGLEGLSSLKVDGTMDRAQEAGDLLVDDLRIVIDAWETIDESSQQEDWVQVSRSLRLLREHLKQKGRGENWAPAKPRAVIKELQKIYQETIGKAEFDLAVDRKLATEIIPALRAIFRYADQYYSAAREQINGLDFDDLEEKILHLFNDFPEVLTYWQGEVQALLVDEYQDTNARQRELVNLLTGGDNQLFIVGDGKQSIYRFRGADVAVFRQEQKRIAGKGESYHLERSYRSHPILLENLNSMLAPVLGDADDLPYLEPFSELKSGREEPPGLDLPAYVEVHLALGVKTAGAGNLAAEAVAARLLEILGRDSGRDGSQQINFGDVAVLCRASSSFSAFEGAFEKAGIPYTTISGQGFFERPEIRDVLNALRVFADPGDDLALAGLMRSPAGGFPDGFLLDLRDFQRTEKLGSLFEAARAYPGQEADVGKLELDSFISIVEEYSTLAGRVTTAELISRFLERTAYAAGLTLAGLERSVNNLRKLVSDAQASGIVNLIDFLNYIEEIRDVAVREGEAQMVSEGAVQIMSVHQAKGLEFPVVILGDAAKRERFTRDILLDDQFGLIPPFTIQRLEEDPAGRPFILSGGSFAYEIALEAERLKEEAETNRLLYVAATRAQDLLIISGVAGNPTRGGGLPNLAGWLGKLSVPLGLGDLDLELDGDGSQIHRMLIENPGLDVSLSLYERRSEFDFSGKLPQIGEKDGEGPIDPGLWEKVNLHIGAAKLAEMIPKPIYPAAKNGTKSRAPSRVVGDVVHQALRRWKFPADGEADFIDWAEVEFRSAGIYDSQAIRSGYRRVRQILERFSATELFARMETAEILLHEVPYSLPGEKDSYQTGSIDALFREEGGWILVEFKTDEIRPGREIDWGSVDYLQQVGDYLNAAERLLKQRPDPILCFLDYGGRVKLVTDRW